MESLIIEDDLTTRTILEKWLTRYGNCQACASGEEGVDAFDIALKAGCSFELICLDINMPGINGHQTLERIRAIEAKQGIESGQGAKVLMVTANDDSRSVMEAFKGQCDGYLVKPLSKSKLLIDLKKMGFKDLTPKS